jgi:hypothetical protein
MHIDPPRHYGLGFKSTILSFDLRIDKTILNGFDSLVRNYNSFVCEYLPVLVSIILLNWYLGQMK